MQTSKFSYEKVYQILKMVIMGIFAVTIVSFTIMPISARKELRKDILKTTDTLGDLLAMITRNFLSGSEQELKELANYDANKTTSTIFGSLAKNLQEAKWEHYALGEEKEYRIESHLVRCMERLAQSLGGLRSAAATQYTLLSKYSSLHSAINDHPGLTSPPPAFHSSRSMSLTSTDSMHILNSITEEPESDEDDDLQIPGLPRIESFASGRFSDFAAPTPNLSPAEIFSSYISHLGPPMVRFPGYLRNECTLIVSEIDCIYAEGNPG